MTITSTRPSALLRTTGRHLGAMLGAVLPHLAPDDDAPSSTLGPALDHLHIEVCGGELLFVATDRYTMGLVRHALTDHDDQGALHLAVPGDAARELAAVMAARGDTDVAIHLHEDRLLVTAGDSVHTVPAEPSGLPWRRVLARHLRPEDPAPTSRFLVNPWFLARLEAAQALDEEWPMRLQTRGPGGAVIATLGTAYLALLMPMRATGPDERRLPSRPLDGWLGLLGEDGGEHRG